MAAGSAAERAEAKGRASARKRGREVRLLFASCSVVHCLLAAALVPFWLLLLFAFWLHTY